MAVQWDAKFDTGISEIDTQHKKLLSMVNQVETLVNSDGVDRAAAAQLLKDMSHYVTTHFYLEELQMQDKNYPDFEAHKKMHEKFEDKVASLQDEFGKIEEEKELQNFLETLSKFLTDWLLNHIQKSDQEYVPYLRKKRA